MFASKLLNILEALPADDDEHGDRVVLDTPEEKSNMTENEEANSSALLTNDFLDSNVDLSCKESFSFDTKDMDETWKVSELDGSAFLDDIFRINDSEVRASTVEDDPNEALPNTINAVKCDTKDRDEKWNTPEFEFSFIPDLIDEKGNEGVIPDVRLTSGYKFFETDEKRVEDYELPELVVFYKESSWNTAQPVDEDQHTNTTESADSEVSSESKSSVESEKNEDDDTELVVPNDSKPDSPEEVFNDDDDSEGTYLEDLIMIFGSKGTAKWKHSNKEAETDSSANVTPRSDQSKQPDQVELHILTEEADTVAATDLFNDSKLATEATVFDLSSTEPASTINLDQGVENFVEPSQDVANVGKKSLGDFLVYSQGYLADGERSFSSVGHGSGPVINSRRISSFGRMSVGSDSSATSNGSFAFPVLKREWYSSPVRLVEEEETGHARKPRSWKQGILCCHF